MTITATAKSLLTGTEQLGTDDDGPVLSSCATRLINRNPGNDVVLDLEGLDYRCETSVQIGKDVTVAYDFTLGRGLKVGKIFATSDYGPYQAGTLDARNNAHVLARTVAAGSKLTIAPFLRIHGSHDPSKPGRSPDVQIPGSTKIMRNCLEQRCGIWVIGPFATVKACAVDIEEVWGDFVDLYPGVNAGLDQCVQQATIVPGRWVRNGRVGVHALCRDLLLQGGDRTFVDKVVSDFYHVESQSGFEKSGIGNHQVQGIHVGDVGRFAGCSGMINCGDILITANSRENGPVNVHCVPRSGYWVPSLTVTNNYWAITGEGSMVLNAWAVKHLTYKFNVGPVKGDVVRNVGYHNCPNAEVSYPTLPKT